MELRERYERGAISNTLPERRLMFARWLIEHGRLVEAIPGHDTTTVPPEGRCVAVYSPLSPEIAVTAITEQVGSAPRPSAGPSDVHRDRITQPLTSATGAAASHTDDDLPPEFAAPTPRARSWARPVALPAILILLSLFAVYILTAAMAM
jgi:hypothetical protein